MKFNNYRGFASFKVIDNNNQLYTLKEKKTGHNIQTSIESLASLRNVERDTEELILPGQDVFLFCKWENHRWQVYPLRPGQFVPFREQEEHSNLEFKKQGIISFEEDVTAFANHEGGTLIWGYDETTKKIVGVQNLLDKYGSLDKLTANLRNRLKQNTNTLLFMNVSFKLVYRESLPCLEISIPKSESVVLYKDALYVRSNNTTQRLSGDRMISFIVSRTNKS